MTETKRDYWFDNAKTILILLVVVGHLAENLIIYTDFPEGDPHWLSVLFRAIYIFHMPGFLVISGRFARGRIDRNDWPAVINKLLVPYLVLQTVMMIWLTFTGVASLSNFSYIGPVFGVWYLFNVTVYSLITPRLKKVPYLFVIALVLAVVIQMARVAPAGGFMRVITYYPFFLFGYYSRNWNLDFCRKAWFRVVSVLAFVVLGVVVWKMPQYFPVEVLTMKRAFTGVLEYLGDISRLEFLIYTIGRYIVGFAFFFFVMGIAPKKKTCISYVGTYSVYVYSLHLIIIILLRALGKYYDFLDFFNNNWAAGIFVVLGIPLSMLLASGPVRKWMAWLAEPKFDIEQIINKLIKK